MKPNKILYLELDMYCYIEYNYVISVKGWNFPQIPKDHITHGQTVQRSQIFRVSLRSHSLVIKRVRSHFRSQFLEGVHSHSSLPKNFVKLFQESIN